MTTGLLESKLRLELRALLILFAFAFLPACQVSVQSLNPPEPVSSGTKNHAPIGVDGSVAVAENSQVQLTLSASDEDANDKLTYTIVMNPFHGTLSGLAPDLIYTPTTGFTGSDSVTFKANDGTLDSNTATISITVNAATAANHAPIATAQTMAVNDNATLSITLAGTDSDAGDTLTYAVVTSPTHGTLTGTAPTLTYHPTAPYNGADSFTFKANDGHVDSTATATISITVTHVNHAPNTPASISCTASPAASSTLNACSLTHASPVDPDNGDTVTYLDAASTCSAVVVNSATGNATFTAPAKGATCLVKVKAFDSVAYSGVVASSTITGANRAPSTPTSISCNTSPPAGSTGNTCTITAASPADPDGDSVTYADAASTCSGVAVDGTTGAATFTAPTKGATCVIKVKAYDGTAYSSVTTSSIITGANNAPVAADTTVNVPDLSTAITLAGTDDDGDSLTYTVLSAPSNGALSGTAPNLTYTVTGGYIGSDSFTFKVNDGTADSVAATVSIAILPIRYFNHDCGTAADANWDTVQNWWIDASCGVQASSSPPDGADVFLVGTVAPITGPAALLSLALFDTTGLGGNFDSMGGSVSANISVSAVLALGDAGNHNHYFNGSTTNSSVLVDAYGYTYLCSEISGSIRLYGSSYASGNLIGDVSLYGSSAASNVQGDLNCYDDSEIISNVSGNATFNDRCIDDGAIIGGNAKFNYASNQTLSASGQWWYWYSGTALDQDNNPIIHWNFNDGAQNWGVISGDASFSDNSANSGTVNGDATFNDSSNNQGTVTGSVTCNGTGSCTPQ